MSDKTWKAAERKIAAFFGAKRRGADFRNRNGAGGKTDVVKDGWAIEIKQSKSPTFGLMKSAVEQAETNRESPGDIPLAVIHKTGEEYKNSLVIMRLETFTSFFVNFPIDNPCKVVYNESVEISQ